ncbi:MAG: helix-turn-helix domain-containing protein [Candidatus Cloacimonetes bacterium]|nr:helix-turn-helix domain-containing protein [Candidatus Cloacimonadota bacterium]
MERNAFLTVGEAVKILHVTRRTIYKYCFSGRLESTKPAGKIYITLESVLRFLTEQTTEK